ncbi:hypothetical protein A3860_21835 [Niastella vici]|uniref:Ig-like domain-containing protein n=2 Tax=Niastella vici TaxID=1703345 RepID=A0A1V9G0A2_9BACT|nr:hypothetical protein A3860_21835 [Niastella vici]
MKPWIIILFLFMLHLSSFCQLNTGGFHAGFGVDADTRAGYLKYGPTTGTISSDDWFSSPTASGTNVIDTSNASTYRTRLQAGNNISFVKRMSVPLYTNVSGRIWLDAIYTRDYITGNTDSTTFTGGGKNGDDPANWHGIASSIPDKTDLIDVFGHMRRNGINVHDSLWFFTGVSTVGTSGSRYFDIELYKNHITYNSTTGNFTTGGPNAGHTAWLFDAAGNITQTGDMIVAVSYSSGAPTVEVRIWTSKTTYNTITPSLFNFGSSFDGSTTSYGYASIVSKSGTTAFGSGIANLSATPAADTTYATPWGSNNTSGWSAQYNSLQFIEVGLNLTRIGIDPALYSSVLSSGACGSSFASIFFKSRSSASFTSNLQDFAGPFDFLQTPVLDYSLTGPSLSCATTTGTINVTNNTTAGYYTFSTTNGTITGTSSNSAQLSKAGTYFVQAAVAQGCPVTRTDTVTVATDTFPPVASFYASVTADLAHFVLHGGNASASNYATPFGGSQGLLWNWSGPKGFTSSTQTPTTDTSSGLYQLTVTEIRNGCTATASNYISLAVLVKGNPVLSDPRNTTTLSCRLTNNGLPGNTHLVVNTPTTNNATLVIHDATGAVVYNRNLILQKGRNDIALSSRLRNQLHVVTLYINNQLTFIKKAIL